MESANTFQAMVVVVAITTALILCIRLIGQIAVNGHPDTSQPHSAAQSGGMDHVLMMAILTAAVYEELGTDQFTVTSYVETPAVKEHHWPYKGIPKHFRTDSTPRP
ncbi:MAG TPA: hypothetical protein PKO15_18950 [Fibrobacteria bacterium]|nr:hypothetical protein [Fibrobacteria bacterium]